MTSPLRKKLIRIITQAQNDLDRLLIKFKKLHDQYEISGKEHNKSYAIQTTQIEQFTKLVVQVKELLEKFRWESM